MNRVYTFEHSYGNVTKEMSLVVKDEPTLGELRALFYDFLAGLGYPVQTVRVTEPGTLNTEEFPNIYKRDKENNFV